MPQNFEGEIRSVDPQKLQEHIELTSSNKLNNASFIPHQKTGEIVYLFQPSITQLIGGMTSDLMRLPGKNVFIPIMDSDQKPRTRKQGQGEKEAPSPYEKEEKELDRENQRLLEEAGDDFGWDIFDKEQDEEDDQHTLENYENEPDEKEPDK